MIEVPRLIPSYGFAISSSGFQDHSADLPHVRGWRMRTMHEKIYNQVGKWQTLLPSWPYLTAKEAGIPVVLLWALQEEKSVLVEKSPKCKENFQVSIPVSSYY